MKAKSDGAGLGNRVRNIRKDKGISLNELSEKTGLSKSTLYKVEGNSMSLTYENLIKLSRGLGVDVAELFSPQPTGSTTSSGSGLAVNSLPGRLVYSKLDNQQSVATHNYVDSYLCTALVHKTMDPVITEVKAKSLEEFGEFSRHPGEEFTYVLSGEINVYTEAYQPINLKKGEYIYFDSQMGHAYICLSKQPAVILTVCVGHQ